MRAPTGSRTRSSGGPASRAPAGALRNASATRGPAAATVAAALGALAIGGAALAQVNAADPPPSLSETGLFADIASLDVEQSHLAFAPQYPLWTDGADKRRWISLPPGTAIDASDPDAWIFPVGTRLWKEFAFEGRRVETRYMERLADGSWIFAAYEWNADGSEATLAPERGRRGAYPLADGRSHTIPGVSDCKVCHGGGASEVLGFSALQLSPDRDPGALHSKAGSAAALDLDLDELVERGLLVGLPGELRHSPPRIAAASPTERAALGYLHGNCGHCHNDRGALKTLGLFLRHAEGVREEPAIASAVGQPVVDPAPGQTPDAVLRVEPGHPERSALFQRIGSRNPALQMPPLGTERVDQKAIALIERWIAEHEPLRAETPTRANPERKAL